MTANFSIIRPLDERRLPLIVHLPHSGETEPDCGPDLSSDLRLMHLHLALQESEPRWLFWPAVQYGATIFRNEVSRAMFDPERLWPDELEPRSRLGFGAVYRRGLDGEMLDGRDDDHRVRELIERFYLPYQQALKQLVCGMLEEFGCCWIVNAHSYQAEPQPYEDPALVRPVVCLGFDDTHVPRDAVTWFLDRESLMSGLAGHEDQPLLGLNSPRVGSFVPGSPCIGDPRVKSLSIGVNGSAVLHNRVPWGNVGFLSVSDMLMRFFGWLSRVIADEAGIERTCLDAAAAAALGQLVLDKYQLPPSSRIVRVYEGDRVLPLPNKLNSAGFDRDHLCDCWVLEVDYEPFDYHDGAPLTCHVDRWTGLVRWLGRMAFAAIDPPAIGGPRPQPLGALSVTFIPADPPIADRITPP
jgi:N-formylglutamate amidohydrolase